MKTRALLFIIILAVTVPLCCCTPVRRSIDKRSGFSAHLEAAENGIREEDWDSAKNSITESIATWKRIKPYLQLDIDHDYINDIEASFTLLRAYIESREKSHCLAYILLIRDTWENIGSM